MNAFFNVVREPAKFTFNGVTKEINKDVLINGETGEALGVVSKQYNLVQNAEVKNHFDEAFDDYDVTVIKDHLSNTGTKWIRELVFNDDQFIREIVPTDVVNLKLKLWNGYDGNTSVGFALEGYRQICTNGMMGWKDMFSTKLPHWGQDIIGLIRNSFSTQFNNYQMVFDKASAWATQPFNQIDFNKFVSDKVKVDTKTSAVKYLSEKQAEYIKAQYPIVMNKYGEKETLWGSYNVLTYIATHLTETKSNSSHLFTQGYHRMEKLTGDFVKMAA